MNTASPAVFELTMVHEKDMQQRNHMLPRMPPWFNGIGNQKLYEALGGVLRLVGLSLASDSKGEGSLSVTIDIPLENLQKLVFELRKKEYSEENWEYCRLLLKYISEGKNAQEESYMNTSPEIWDLPTQHKSSPMHFAGEDDISLHFFRDTAMLHQVIIEGIVRSTSNAILHVLSSSSGYPTAVGKKNSYIGIAHEILPLLEEPMHKVSSELEILGRHQHPNLTGPFLKAVAEIARVSKHESNSLPSKVASYTSHVKSLISNGEKQA
ncbi:TELO2-interacting protein 1-like protein isoform X1 [Cucumis melo var. makuwa]|uniref:TELO2-interacting protein 1-like protein isoform X1 n=1 Tax=Cucumis melo var. makuwa TaxID=1194695 RepID=A0A5A7UIP6_CUCMM|nr:TELO2-interacting protein 1-like protein isoform X1 [Cucumis melo var. makuwa]